MCCAFFFVCHWHSIHSASVTIPAKKKKAEEKDVEWREFFFNRIRSEEDAFAPRFRWRSSSSISTSIRNFIPNVLVLLQTGRQQRKRPASGRQRRWKRIVHSGQSTLAIGLPAGQSFAQWWKQPRQDGQCPRYWNQLIFIFKFINRIQLWSE